MDSLSSFFKDRWVVFVQLATILIVFLTDIMVPPEIADSLSISQLNIIGVSKFIGIGLILILAIPFHLYKSKKNAKVYWAIAMLFFVMSSIALVSYNMKYEEKTAYDELKKKRAIIGDKYLPEVVVAIDSLRLKNSDLVITPEILLEGYGEPQDIWPKDEIEHNARQLVLRYLLFILLGVVFILTGFQAVKCLAFTKRDV